MGRFEKRADPFYHTGAWKRIRIQVLERDCYFCQECLRQIKAGRPGKPRTATMVHHIKARKEFPELALSMENLESLCNICHERLTPERRPGGRKARESGRRTIVIRNEVGKDDQ